MAKYGKWYWLYGDECDPGMGWWMLDLPGYIIGIEVVGDSFQHHPYHKNASGPFVASVTEVDGGLSTEKRTKKFRTLVEAKEAGQALAKKTIQKHYENNIKYLK